tara:strand:- start:560 stop:817 length:258 start_codon:yes stop_codon:yes gene_type:complete
MKRTQEKITNYLLDLSDKELETLINKTLRDKLFRLCYELIFRENPLAVPVASNEVKRDITELIDDFLIAKGIKKDSGEEKNETTT